MLDLVVPAMDAKSVGTGGWKPGESSIAGVVHEAGELMSPAGSSSGMMSTSRYVVQHLLSMLSVMCPP